MCVSKTPVSPFCFVDSLSDDPCALPSLENYECTTKDVEMFEHEHSTIINPGSSQQGQSIEKGIQ